VAVPYVVRLTGAAGSLADVDVWLDVETAGSEIPPGFPDASTTGPSNPELIDTTYDRLVCRDPGVYENFRAENVLVYADNVTLRNFEVVRDDPTAWFAVATQKTGGVGPTNLVLEDGRVTCEVNGVPTPSKAVGLNASDFTARRLDISYMADGIADHSGLVEDCFIHNMVRYEGSHNDGIQCGKVGAFVIRHNTIIMEQQTGAVNISTNAGPINDVLIEGNYLGGGSYTLYVRDNAYGTPTGVTIRDNLIRRGQYGFLSAESDAVIVWENNRDADTGDLIEGPT